MQQAPGQTPQGQGPGGPPQGRGGQGGPGGRGGFGGRGPAVTVPPEFDYAPIWVLDEPKLIAILKDPSSTMFQKAIACKKLGQIGTRASIQPMAALLGDQRLGSWARYGLESNPDSAVDEALRAALPRLNGLLQVGVIHSIGIRKDARALDALGKLMNSTDPQIAQAASASVAMIGGVQAARLLRDALGRATPPVFPVVARAALLCAEGLMAANRTQGLEMYTALTAAKMPEPVRLASIRALNVALGAPAA